MLPHFSRVRMAKHLIGKNPMEKIFLDNVLDNALNKNIVLARAMVFLSLFLLVFTNTAHAADKEFLDKSCSEFQGILKQDSGKKPVSDSVASHVGKWVRWSGKVVTVEETLWGADIGVKCSDSAGKADVTLSFDSKPTLSPGKQITFMGQVDGFSELGGILLKSAEIIQNVQMEQRPHPPADSGRYTPPVIAPPQTAPPPPSPTVEGSTDAMRNVMNEISAKVRSYFGFVQSREVDRAIMLYSAAKRPNIKRNVIEGVARDTEYYRIDRIEPVRLGPVESRVVVYLWHKRLKSTEEYWEIFMDFLNEQGEWRIVSTPGKRIR